MSPGPLGPHERPATFTASSFALSSSSRESPPPTASFVVTQAHTTSATTSQPLRCVSTDQAENDEPQPHEDFALGFSNLNPADVSVFT